MGDGESRLVAFVGEQKVSAGLAAEVAVAVWRQVQRDAAVTPTVLDARTGAVVDLDLRGSAAEIVARHSPSVVPQRGRPKLGVVAKEVTLMPRHWEWLATQPGGASATLRRLVESASRTNDPANDERLRREAAYRFMSALAGDRSGFESASRALFAGDRAQLTATMAAWPPDIANQIESALDGR